MRLLFLIYDTGNRMKRIIFILILSAANLLFAEDKFSAGLTAGYQYDVGMLSEKPGIIGNVQQNISGGLILKLDMSRVFIRSGVEYSYPFRRGRIVENISGNNVEGTFITFTEVPVYGGINLSIRDFGAIYLGGGGSYIFGSGHAGTTSGSKKINEQLFGYGILAGVESEIYSNASLMFEWEYMSARSAPVASASGSYNDYSIDYSGHRVRLGMIYHFNRY